MSELLIEPQLRSLPLARRWARALAEGAHLPARAVQVIELLTSELVANAVNHGPQEPILLRAQLGAGLVTIMVTDQGDDMPVMRTTGPEVPGGQGVRIVDRLATTWGVDRHQRGGKTVWFTLVVGGPRRD